MHTQNTQHPKAKLAVCMHYEQQCLAEEDQIGKRSSLPEITKPEPQLGLMQGFAKLSQCDMHAELHACCREPSVMHHA